MFCQRDIQPTVDQTGRLNLPLLELEKEAERLTSSSASFPQFTVSEHAWIYTLL